MRTLPPKTFQTARLTAAVPESSDTEEAFEIYASDPEVTRYLSWKAYSEPEPLREFLEGRARAWEDGDGHFAWILRLRESGAIVGSIGVELQGHTACFGYVLGKSYWGRGLTAEALNYLTHWALAQPGIFRAWAFCDAENKASARVMEKCGFEREGCLHRWHVCPTIGTEPRDCLVLAKTR